MKRLTFANILLATIQLSLGVLFVYFFFPFTVEKVVSFEGYKPGFFDHLYKVVVVKQPFNVLADETELGYPVAYKNEPLLVEIEYLKYFESVTDYNRFIVCDNGDLVTMTGIDFAYQPIGDFTGENKIVSSYHIIPLKTSINTPCKLVLPTTWILSPFRQINDSVESEKFIVKER